MIRGRIFREMIRVSAQKTELQAKKSELQHEKSELQPGRPTSSEPNRPEKKPEWCLGASTENLRCVQLAGFFSNVILANRPFNRLQVRK